MENKRDFIKKSGNAKENRAEQARKHTQEMEQLYSERIKESIENTIIYDVDFRSNKTHSCKMDIIVEAADSVSAIISHAEECKNRMAVLNFSSYKYPGGGFINGSRAQEECLCGSKQISGTEIPKRFKRGKYEGIEIKN